MFIWQFILFQNIEYSLQLKLFDVSIICLETRYFISASCVYEKWFLISEIFSFWKFYLRKVESKSSLIVFM